MERYISGSRLLPLVALLGMATIGLVAGAAWGEAQKKVKPPVFPLSLFSSAQPEDYVDDQMCAGCHPDVAAEFGKLYHAPLLRDAKLPPDRRGCQACHGPGAGHIANMEDADKIGLHIIRYAKIKPAEASAACMRCHGSTMHAAEWNRQAHARSGLGCLSCHTVHHGKGSDTAANRLAPADDIRKARNVAGIEIAAGDRTLKASQAVLCAECHKREAGEFRRNFHHPVPEGNMECSDCHEPHPTKARSRREPFVKGQCVRCHPEAGGPFRFEHEPVAGWTGDGCIECHRPHGSHNPALLSSFSRGLCAQCHTDLRISHYPGQTCWNSGCHEAVHGSNSDRTLLKR